jgi:DNA-directed RNA polymerase II subunit RPB9
LLPLPPPPLLLLLLLQAAEPGETCVHVTELKHDAKEQTVVLQDVTADPTLPRTQEVTCPKCQHNEAVFFSASSEQGMTLFFNCMLCQHRWRDYV